MYGLAVFVIDPNHRDLAVRPGGGAKDTFLRRDITCHIAVPVEMVRCDVQQDSDVEGGVLRQIQLVRR